RYDLVLFVSLYEHLTRPQQDLFLERLKGWLAPGGVVATHTITAASWLGRGARPAASCVLWRNIPVFRSSCRRSGPPRADSGTA
ncbi:MAG: hypothetical protein AAB576_07670, partial [Elusimicrobiota bacterium]